MCYKFLAFLGNRLMKSYARSEGPSNGWVSKKAEGGWNSPCRAFERELIRIGHEDCLKTLETTAKVVL